MLILLLKVTSLYYYLFTILTCCCVKESSACHVCNTSLLVQVSRAYPLIVRRMHSVSYWVVLPAVLCVVTKPVSASKTGFDPVHKLVTLKLIKTGPGIGLQSQSQLSSKFGTYIWNTSNVGVTKLTGVSARKTGSQPNPEPHMSDNTTIRADGDSNDGQFLRINRFPGASSFSL